MKQTNEITNKQQRGPVYLDCNATTPVEPRVQETMIRWMSEEVGNAGSRTHEYGVRAHRAVQKAREQVAQVVEARADEVLFTSGATESNNLAILGLQKFGEKNNRRHIITTAIEHKAVLEPIEVLESQGFSVTLIRPDQSGRVTAESVKSSLRPDTLLVSVMHANNETGAIQPISKIANILDDSKTYFHVDAAQGYGKDLKPLCRQRIDLISISGHKIYGPVGTGALVVRRRGFQYPPLKPLVYGGGQERGLRPGTLPVPLIVGLGMAAQTALEDVNSRKERCHNVRKKAMAALEPLKIQMHSPSEYTLSHVLNFSIPGIDSEAVMIALKDVAAVSNGSACTSQNYAQSHVLAAMGLTEEAISGAIRISWSHLTPEVDWLSLTERINSLR